MSIIVLLAVCGGESLGSEEFIRIETEIELIRHQPTTNGVEMRRRVYPAIIITSTNRWSIELHQHKRHARIHRQVLQHVA